MKYLILILTLLFSFNVKAETWSCAFQDSQQAILSKTDNDQYQLLSNGDTFDYQESAEMLVIYSANLSGDFYLSRTYMINKVDLTARVVSYLYGFDGVLDVSGRCQMLP